MGILSMGVKKILVRVCPRHAKRLPDARLLLWCDAKLVPASLD